MSSSSPAAHIVPIDSKLYLIILPVPLSGFDHFIGSWVVTDGLQIIIDPGPAVSAPALLDALAEVGVQRPDLVLFTHIHIDHAGAAGILARQFPHTTLVCHPKAIDHLIDPTQLWQGTLKTLGRPIATAYAPFEPVSPKAILSADRLDASEIIPIATPGHAPHHYSYLAADKVLFAGEAAGICLPVGQGRLYLRPATPPRFFKDVYLQSLDRLMACRARLLCYGHLDTRADPEPLLVSHRDQIDFWEQWILPWFEQSPSDPATVMEGCLENLLAVDPLLKEFDGLPQDVQQREKGFLRNAIRGYWGFLASKNLNEKD